MATAAPTETKSKLPPEVPVSTIHAGDKGVATVERVPGPAQYPENWKKALNHEQGCPAPKGGPCNCQPTVDGIRLALMENIEQAARGERTSDPWLLPYLRGPLMGGCENFHSADNIAAGTETIETDEFTDEVLKVVQLEIPMSGMTAASKLEVVVVLARDACPKSITGKLEDDDFLEYLGMLWVHLGEPRVGHEAHIKPGVSYSNCNGMLYFPKARYSSPDAVTRTKDLARLKRSQQFRKMGPEQQRELELKQRELEKDLAAVKGKLGIA